MTAYCGWHKNTLGEEEEAATAVIEGCEDELAAAEICELLIEKVVHEEQRRFVKMMVSTAGGLAALSEAAARPAEGEAGGVGGRRGAAPGIPAGSSRSDDFSSLLSPPKR